MRRLFCFTNLPWLRACHGLCRRQELPEGPRSCQRGPGVARGALLRSLRSILLDGLSASRFGDAAHGCRCTKPNPPTKAMCICRLETLNSALKGFQKACAEICVLPLALETVNPCMARCQAEQGSDTSWIAPKDRARLPKTLGQTWFEWVLP